MHLTNRKVFEGKMIITRLKIRFEHRKERLKVMKKRVISFVLTLALALAMLPAGAFAADEGDLTTNDNPKSQWSADKTSYYDANGEKVTGAKKIGSKVWYFNKSGIKRTKRGFFKAGGNEYYAKKDGSLATGFKAIKSGEKLKGYYFYKKGDKIAQMAKGTKIKYLKIPKSGRLNEAYALGIKVLDKKGWKLRNAFKYARNTRYDYKSMRRKSISSYAKFGFKNRTGNCYCKAAQFFVMAKLLGYNVHMYSGKVGSETHSWTTIKHDDGTWMYDPVVLNSSSAWNHSFWYKFKKGQKGTWRYSKAKRMD